MFGLQSFSFENKIFRVIPHQNKNMLFVEIFNTQNSNLCLYILDLMVSKIEFLMEYHDKQLLDFATYSFLVFKLFPSKVLPIVRGIKIYDLGLNDYVLEEPEAQNLEYFHDKLSFEIFDKIQTIKFPSQKMNQFLFPEIIDNKQVFIFQNIRIVVNPQNLEIFHQNQRINEITFQDNQLKNCFVINSFLIIQTKNNEITVYTFNFL